MPLKCPVFSEFPGVNLVDGLPPSTEILQAREASSSMTAIRATESINRKFNLFSDL